MSKFATDLGWTYGSLIVMAASGFLINLIIGLAFGAEGLGAFNQALALFVIIAQLSALGFHLWVFKSTAEFADERATVDSVVSSGLLLAVVSGLVFSTLLFVLAEPIGALLGSQTSAEALRHLAPALLLFNINKVLLSALNGLRLMRSHAIGQVIRYASLLAVVLWAGLASLDVADAAYCFLGSELALLAFLAPSIRRHITPSPRAADPTRLRQCLVFGIKGFWSGMAAELNIRTDILVIGLFLDDAYVGVYALASVAYEGVINAFYVVRLNLNPSLVGILKARDWPALERDLGRVSRWLYPIAALVYLLAAALYLPVVWFVFGDTEFVLGYWPLLILLAPLVLFAGLLPFDQILLQAGYAGRYSATLAMTFAVNLGLNLLLVPQLGLIGAASATSLALLVGIGYFLYMANRVLRWNAASYVFSRLSGGRPGTH